MIVTVFPEQNAEKRSRSWKPDLAPTFGLAGRLECRHDLDADA
jgi:hypothetical protein